MPGRVVKNAPYSADVITETTQALPDGNRIHQTNSTRVYRDSDGRTRREQSLRSLGGLAPNADLPQMVFITDPVAGFNYAVNAKDRTATKNAWAPPRGRGDAPGGRGAGRGQQPQQQQDAAPMGRFRGGRANQNIRTESLGQQNMDGVLANGTRTTLSIPAGQMGNDQPIQIVTETWYSKELQMVVYSKHSDPRSGETVMRLENVSRSEPARSLFDVPADYKVTEGRGFRGRPPAPAAVK
jgi:hypothetical protein